MGWTLDPDGDPGPIHVPDDPLVQAENKQEALIKQIVRIERDEENKKVIQAEVEFSRLPWWVQASEAGDYMSDGSDLQGYDFDD